MAQVVSRNRQARHDYDIAETVEAGIILSGQEAKSCREGHADLKGAYVSFQEGTPLLKHMHIAPYRHAGHLAAYDPTRDRTLLFAKKQLAHLREVAEQKGVSVIPMEVRAGRFIKVLLGVGSGRKKYDKRQKKKERDIGRRLRRGEESTL